MEPTTTQNKQSQAAMTPETALQALKDGNQRFVNKMMNDRDLSTQVAHTATGQFPFATVLGCIDSRVTPELVFDQGIGDIFSARVAGNFVNEDILGSMEFASKLAGTKLIVVLGHTSCGAIKGACDGARLGNLTKLIEKLEPAVDAVAKPSDPRERTSANLDFVNAVAYKNIEITINHIKRRSSVLSTMLFMDDIAIVGAMYHIDTGRVEFLD